MLKFFRTIRRHLLDSGSLRKYFVYAIGEILLVVIGILIALQINNWNQDRKDKKLEQEILKQFLIDLNGDIESLKENRRWTDMAIVSTTILTDHLKRKLPFHDSLTLHFDNWIHSDVFSFNEGAISNLNSRGVQIISNPLLRNRILKLYNKSYEKMNLYQNYYREDHISLSYPIFLKQFEPIEWTKKATPNNYDALLEDQEFINHLQWIKNAAKYMNLTSEDLEKEMYAIIKAIEGELNK